jgi:pimeloyl-ACP methyl ester carboxylesterase
MDNLGIEKAILAGNSAGGKIAAYAAYKYPDRITKLILIDPAIRAGRRQPAWINVLFESPQMDRIGPLISRLILIRGEDLLRVAWHDPFLITQEIIDGYKKPLRMADWDKGLWEFTKAAQVDIEHLLKDITQPVLILTGDNDRIVPTQQTVELASQFTNGKLVIIESSGHVPQEEQPEEFVYQIMKFLQ